MAAHMNGHTNGYSNGVTNGVTNGDHTSVEQKDETFLKGLFNILLEEGFNKGKDVNTPVVNFEHPAALRKRLDLEIGENGEENDKLLKLCADTIHYSVRTSHPRFFNQLFSGQDAYGLGGAWLTETVNTSAYTFEVAPVFTLMEQAVLKKMRDLVGYESGDGIFCPGGSVSNMYGLNLARYQQFPQVKTEGMQSLPRLCLFTSAQSHYSVKKGAALLGIGINNVRYVACDERGRMLPEALDTMITEAKEQGFCPYLVNGTGGTTVTGAYDPLDAIADVCQKHKVWLHVDCCWGGGALLSSKHKHLLKGLERADSLSWNPHKMMGTPLQCCAFLTKHEGLLQAAHSANAEYLFQQDKFYDVSFDTGDKSVQCGRKVDVFKLWLMWKAKGDNGFEEGIDNAFANAKYLTNKLQQTEGFRLVFPEPECTNVCFWYIPPSLRGQEETPEWWDKLSKVAPVIKERMVKEGTMLIGYNPLGDKVNFFRMVISNLGLSNDNMEFVISELHRLGQDL